MTLDETAAIDVVGKLAAKLSLEPARAAWDVLQVANATMERAIRRISVERGFDPREFTLVPFGGAGPLHACDLAASLQIPRVFIPPIPGVLSALGMLVAAPTKDYSRTVMLPIAAGEAASAERIALLDEQLSTAFQPLAERGLQEMVAEGYDVTELTWHYELDMRYAGQSHELKVPFFTGKVETLAESFHRLHERRYGYMEEARSLEVVTLRLTVEATVEPPVLPAGVVDELAVSRAIVGHKEVYFADGRHETTLYDRALLSPGYHFSGPAIIFQYDTTTVIPPQWQVQVDTYLNLIITATNR